MPFLLLEKWERIYSLSSLESSIYPQDSWDLVAKHNVTRTLASRFVGTGVMLTMQLAPSLAASKNAPSAHGGHGCPRSHNGLGITAGSAKAMLYPCRPCIMVATSPGLCQQRLHSFLSFIGGAAPHHAHSNCTMVTVFVATPGGATALLE